MIPLSVVDAIAKQKTSDISTTQPMKNENSQISLRCGER